MKKQINKSLKSFLLTIVAMFIMLGASGAIFAQKTDKYPKPDFSAMEEYWEIIEWEYDFAPTSNVPNFIVIAKPKQKVVPVWWDITWLDSKGVKIVKHCIFFSAGQVQQSKIGDPIRGESKAPFKREMAQVKSVKVTENPDGGDAKTAN